MTIFDLCLVFNLVFASFSFFFLVFLLFFPLERDTRNFPDYVLKLILGEKVDRQCIVVVNDQKEKTPASRLIISECQNDDMIIKVQR